MNPAYSQPWRLTQGRGSLGTLFVPDLGVCTQRGGSVGTLFVPDFSVEQDALMSPNLSAKLEDLVVVLCVVV